MRIINFAAAAVLGLALVASTAGATQPTRTDAIRSQQAQIKAGIEARTGVFKDLSTSLLEQLLAQQTVVLGLIEGKQTVDELDETQRRRLVAALASIDSVVNKSSEERMVCKMTKKIGSNMKERVCLTVAQMREREEAARSQIDRHGIDSFIQGN